MRIKWKDAPCPSGHSRYNKPPGWGGFSVSDGSYNGHWKMPVAVVKRHLPAVPRVDIVLRRKQGNRSAVNKPMRF